MNLVASTLMKGASANWPVAQSRFYPPVGPIMRIFWHDFITHGEGNCMRRQRLRNATATARFASADQ